jgi:heme-degrading monooxygenase HmoA
VFLRIWRARVDPQRLPEYERFALQESAAMFREQPGFKGVLFARNGSDCMVVSLWENEDALAALDSAALYRQTAQRLLATGVLLGSQSVEILNIHGYELPDVAAWQR